MYRLREEKQELRSLYLEKRENMDPETKREMDNRIFKRFTSLISYRYSETLLLYYPIRGEVDTLPIISGALTAGKRVALPVCYDNGRMEFFLIKSTDDLESGRFGIPTPKPDCEKLEKSAYPDRMVMVVPALAFDKEGYRLGYGKGYYDRYINELNVTSVGLVYSGFIADKLPRGRYDMSVDLLVSEKGVRLIEKNK